MAYSLYLLSHSLILMVVVVSVLTQASVPHIAIRLVITSSDFNFAFPLACHLVLCLYCPATFMMLRGPVRNKIRVSFVTVLLTVLFNKVNC